MTRMPMAAARWLGRTVARMLADIHDGMIAGLGKLWYG